MHILTIPLIYFKMMNILHVLQGACKLLTSTVNVSLQKEESVYVERPPCERAVAMETIAH